MEREGGGWAVSLVLSGWSGRAASIRFITAATQSQRLNAGLDARSAVAATAVVLVVAVQLCTWDLTEKV